MRGVSASQIKAKGRPKVPTDDPSKQKSSKPQWEESVALTDQIYGYDGI
jgi:hypothetical protein